MDTQEDNRKMVKLLHKDLFVLKNEVDNIWKFLDEVFDFEVIAPDFDTGTKNIATIMKTVAQLTQ